MLIVVLAAGQGKRMNSRLPKVLQPLAHRPLLAHVLDTAKTLQAKRLCVVYGHGGEQVQQAFGEDTSLTWALQSQQLGTGHALAQALPDFAAEADEQTVLVLYGDVPLLSEQTLRQLLANARPGDLVILTASVANASGYGRIVRDHKNNITAIVEDKDATPAQREINEINTGILAAPLGGLRRWLTKLSNSNVQNEYYLTDIVAMAVAEGVTVTSALTGNEQEILGANNKMQLAELEASFRQRQANALLLAGVTLIDPARIDVRGQLACGSDVSIDVNCVFEGEVVLADGVSIGPNCVIRNSVIATNTRVEAFSILDNARVGERCVIGPYARLRPGSALQDEVHVGNFVEIKNSNIANKSRANHLSYIGDADIGERVNIGAGTITCNYDGVNKFRTTIEDDVFIGSDSQLIAPVIVGRGATLGAGTTLSKNAPAEQLTISRSEQVSISKWRRPRKK